ncbi:cytochrome P450 6a8-like [Teleopsis dalmanni]|uniref:cytochrome P450 6a8-like n=1 Tax=Teleopsis dalmanni TaxID=139649 RepID=UPI0018CE54BC|nr:cytochrome P450 6a8-like [Teleopsis dalmanni]XP_037950471.1 cytochrome P450 6a8-like [Teleopsis dalmanni]
MDVIWIIFYTLLIAFIPFYFVFLKRNAYWADRGVLHEKPVLFYGNMRNVGRTQPLRQPFRELYAKYKDKVPFCGFYISLRPAVVLFDLELIKNVLIRDFSKFANRGNYYNEKADPLSAHLFNLDGPKWRDMRVKLTPTFTTGKMKFMFPTVVDVANRFVTVLDGIVKSETSELRSCNIEVKELLARFTTDVIGCCAFGLECNSLQDPNMEFRLMSKKVFNSRRHGRFVGALIRSFPKIARMCGAKLVHEDVSKFFMRVVRENVEYRESEGIQRNDFMNLLIELKNTKDQNALTLEEIAAQAFVFFIAGFETSSSTMGFCLYELALNPSVQNKARDEIEEMFKRHGGQLTYDGLKELKYLQNVLHETMRMYSIASIIMRQTVENYAVPNTNHVIEKDIIVIIPIDAIHYDPAIYPNPTKFDPGRFEPEEVEKRHTMSFLPFGDGPRNCIGMRFGEMQAMIGLVMLLKNFQFSPCEHTKIPIEISTKSVVLSSQHGISLEVKKLLEN